MNLSQLVISIGNTRIVISGSAALMLIFHCKHIFTFILYNRLVRSLERIVRVVISGSAVWNIIRYAYNSYIYIYN